MKKNFYLLVAALAVLSGSVAHAEKNWCRGYGFAEGARDGFSDAFSENFKKPCYDQGYEEGYRRGLKVARLEREKWNESVDSHNASADKWGETDKRGCKMHKLEDPYPS